MTSVVRVCKYGSADALSVAVAIAVVQSMSDTTVWLLDSLA